MGLYRPRNSSIVGALLIFLGICLIGLALFFNIYTKSFHYATLFIYIPGALALVVGIYIIAGSRRDYIVVTKSKNKRSVATIIEKKSYKGGYPYLRPHRSITVTYEGESGLPSEYTVDDIPEDDFSGLEEGMKIYCQVYGESCYIDPLNIELVSEGEEIK